jgi:hypothetical protein
MTKLETNEPGRKAQPLPQLGLHVVVHCPGYSCLGYLDTDGTWKNAFTHETLPNVIGFSLLN